MMVLKKIIRLWLDFFKDIKEWSQEPEAGKKEHPPVAVPPPKPEANIQEIHSIWDYLKIRENTQADHLTNVIGFEWIEMQEIRRRILEQFEMEYKNERSLYPYIKTFTDTGLFESTDIGGKRKWRRRNILVTAAVKQKETEQPIEAKSKQEQGKEKEKPGENN